MEEISYEEARLGNRKQRKGNGERPIRTSRGTVKERESSESRQLRENSTGMSKRVTSQSGGIQNATRDGLLVDKNGISVIPKVSPEKFLSDFKVEHCKAKYSPCVDEPSIEELQERVCFGHKDLGFYSVTEDGNICSVLKSSKNHKKGFTKDLLINALSHNGDKLDCFAIYDGGLVNFYMDVGFIPVCRIKFNPEYAPEGWKEEWGEPDVIVMAHNLDTPDEVVKKYGTYGSYKEYLSRNGEGSVPYIDEYDDALAYRDKVLEDMKKKKYKSPKGVFNLIKKASSDLNF